MDDTLSMELYRKEGTTLQTGSLSVYSNGAVRIDGWDLGEIPERFWGHDDYEFEVTVPGTEICKLVFALLRDRYLGRMGAVGELREFCEKEGIETNFFAWP